jgi:L-Ala-D/L-Glu epimerase
LCSQSKNTTHARREPANCVPHASGSAGTSGTIVGVNLHQARRIVMLREVFRTAIRTTDRVDALVVTLLDHDDGPTGVGFATATPAITGDTVESMEAFLHNRVAGWLGSIPMTVGGIADARRELFTFSSESPSGAAGVDLALADLAGKLTGELVAPVSVATSVTLSAGTAAEMAESARTRIGQGFQTIKCKLGVDPTHDIERLVAVDRMCAEYSPKVSLWVDANQGWTVDQTLRFLDDIVARGVEVERLEQPTPAADFDALATIRTRTIGMGMPLVADESAKTIEDIDHLAALGAADMINVKVMKFGGLIGSELAIERSRTHGLGVLVGSMMEHPQSVATAARLASAQTELVHDLDAGWWALDTTPLHYENGRVSV